MRLEEIKEKFDSTFEEISQKAIKDDENVFYVIEFQYPPVSSRYERIMNEMQVSLVGFLDREQRRAIVSSSYDMRNIVPPNETRDVISNIHPLTVSDVLEESLRGSSSKQLVLINTIPNISVGKIQQHMEKVREFLVAHNAELVSGILDEENKRGSVVAYTAGTTIEEMIDTSNITFSAYKVPEVILSVIKARKKKKPKKEDDVIVAFSSIESKDDDAYEIVEIDSGVSMLKEFQGRVISSYVNPLFNSGKDLNNHGTPIASILLFGHLDDIRLSNGQLRNDYRVYSYKALEKVNGNSKGNLYEGIKFAFDNYKGKSKVFTSSINFTQLNEAAEEEARKIGLLVQSKNVCFVNSVGNFDNAEVEVKNGKKHSEVWNDNPVLHPATATCMTSVGAYGFRRSPLTEAFTRHPTCFNRYGNARIRIKPEVMDFGGNCIVDGSENDEGVCMLGTSGKTRKHGTSFAAPFFARHLAFLVKSLEKENIKNSETFRAIAYSACVRTEHSKEYSGLGVFNYDDLAQNRLVTRIIFEGLFDGFTATTMPFHEVIIHMPVQPVEATLTLVHSDNYALNTKSLDNYTAITVSGIKGQQHLQEKRKELQIKNWTHVRREVFSYSKNPIGRWDFKLSPRVDKIPAIWRPNLKIRYGAVLVVRALSVDRKYDSLKSAILLEMKKSQKAGESIREGTA